MEELFLQCLNLSIRASYMILAVLLIRLLFPGAERKYMVWLWIMVGIRLICPFSFSFLPTILPHSEVIPSDIAMSHSPQIASGFETVDHTVNHILQQNFSPAPGDSVNPLQVLTAFGAAAWAAGIVFMISYMIISSVVLNRQIRRTGKRVRGVVQGRRFETPFVFGLFHPVICLPVCEGERKKMILAHERTHIERKDHILKAAAFLILSVYWFHPLVWLSYRLLCRDMEMACDEAVIQKMKRQERGCYAQTLLEFASAKAGAAGPVAFGETDVKRRIRKILKYRRPSVVSAVCLLVCALIVCTGCFADRNDDSSSAVTPETTKEPESGKEEPEPTPETTDKPEETDSPAQPQPAVLTVESLLADPSPYLNTYVYVQGNLPQGIAGIDESGNPIAYLNGVNDIDQGIRIVDYAPQDGSCLVEAHGTLIRLANGEIALSMDGYTVLSEYTMTSAMTVETVLADPQAYVNTYVYVQGNLPQGISGMDAGGNPIAYLNGAEDLSQRIRIVNYIPQDGNCKVEAYGTIIYLENGEIALSMEGYTVLQ